MDTDRIFKRKIYDRLLKWKETSNGKSALLLQKQLHIRLFLQCKSEVMLRKVADYPTKMGHNSFPNFSINSIAGGHPSCTASLTKPIPSSKLYDLRLSSRSTRP